MASLTPAQWVLWGFLALTPALVCVLSITGRSKVAAWAVRRRAVADWKQTRYATLPAEGTDPQAWINRHSRMQIRVSSSGDSLWCVTYIRPDGPSTFEYNVTEERVRAVIDQHELSLKHAD